MNVDTDHLETLHPEFNPFIVEQLPTGLAATAQRFGKLIYRTGLIAVNECTGFPDPPYVSHGVYQPVRHVKPEADVTHFVESGFGTKHKVDVFNADSLGTERSNLPPLVMTMELSVPSDKGFKATVIESLSDFCTKQGRSLIVVSSEGFAGQELSLRQIANLNFGVMTDNVMDSIDELACLESVEIPEIETTGGSRGGTLSLLLATTGLEEIRFASGKYPRKVVGVTAFAPAGLNRNGPKTAWQFIYDEPSHMIRKASGMNPDVLKAYGESFMETIPPAQAAKAIAKTALLYVLTKPLENIAARLNPDAAVDVVVLNKDGLTSPKQWHSEMKDRPNSNVFEMPGSHLSIDSLRRVYGIAAWHLSGRDMTIVEQARLAQQPVKAA